MDSPGNTERKLAVIMFTDIVDYSAITDKNEKKALDLLKNLDNLNDKNSAERDYLLGKLFFRAHVIFIESSANILKPSLTGRISYFFSDLFIIQFKELLKFYPKAKLSKGFLV